MKNRLGLMPRGDTWFVECPLLKRWALSRQLKHPIQDLYICRLIPISLFLNFVRLTIEIRRGGHQGFLIYKNYFELVFFANLEMIGDCCGSIEKVGLAGVQVMEVIRPVSG